MNSWSTATYSHCCKVNSKLIDFFLVRTFARSDIPFCFLKLYFTFTLFYNLTHKKLNDTIPIITSFERKTHAKLSIYYVCHLALALFNNVEWILEWREENETLSSSMRKTPTSILHMTPLSSHCFTLQLFLTFPLHFYYQVNCIYLAVKTWNI